MTDPYAHPEYLQGLAAIKADPDEEGPRLQLADWLRERGEGARADFIRVQLRLADDIWVNMRCTRCHDAGCEACGPRQALLRRQAELLRGNAARWLPVGGLHAPPYGTRVPFSFPGQANRHYESLGRFAVYSVAEFCRGFVERLTCQAEDWLAHADGLLPLCPLLRVTLTTRPLPFFRSPRTGRIEIPGGDQVWVNRREMDRALERCWPGIEFVVPPVGPIRRATVTIGGVDYPVEFRAE